jgi:hypothetical protein
LKPEWRGAPLVQEEKYQEKGKIMEDDDNNINHHHLHTGIRYFNLS